MPNLNIIKGGIRNTVDAASYERLYKPNGWVIDETEPPQDEVQETVKGYKSEADAKNYLKMTRHKAKKFNDKLFKSEIED